MFLTSARTLLNVADEHGVMSGAASKPLIGRHLGMTRFSYRCFFVVAVSTVAALGCGEEEGAAGACGDSPLVGKHLWQVGNCEVGTVTPVSASSCEVTLCGGNAREVSECSGDRLFELTVHGTRLSSGETLEPMELLRDIDCAALAASGVDGETCAHWQCLIDHSADVFVARFPERAANEQFYPDGLWVALDEAWPGRDECSDSPTLEARFQELADSCPF